MNKFRKYILVLAACWLGIIPVAADNILVLEGLIESHKTLSNRLKNRSTVEGTVAVATNRQTNITDDYENDVVSMQKRIEGAFASVQFTADLAVLTSMAIKTTKLSTRAIDAALDAVGDNPLIIFAAEQALNRSGQCIQSIYKLMAMVVGSGTGVVLATNEDRTQFCFMVRTKLLEIQDIMYELLAVANRMEHRFERYDENNMRARQILDILSGAKHEEAYKKTSNKISMAASQN